MNSGGLAGASEVHSVMRHSSDSPGGVNPFWYILYIWFAVNFALCFGTCHFFFFLSYVWLAFCLTDVAQGLDEPDVLSVKKKKKKPPRWLRKVME